MKLHARPMRQGVCQFLSVAEPVPGEVCTGAQNQGKQLQKTRMTQGHAPEIVLVVGMQLLRGTKDLVALYPMESFRAASSGCA